MKSDGKAMGFVEMVDACFRWVENEGRDKFGIFVGVGEDTIKLYNADVEGQNHILFEFL